MGKLNKELRKARQKKLGEIFTPPKVVEDMLDQFPKEDWGKPELTYLDPCAGATMVFPVMILFRLTNGLRVAIPNVSERIRNIVEKQLYMAELDERSVEFGNRVLNNIISLLEFYLILEGDTEETVGKIRQKYIDNYDQMIDLFYMDEEQKKEQLKRMDLRPAAEVMPQTYEEFKKNME